MEHDGVVVESTTHVYQTSLVHNEDTPGGRYDDEAALLLLGLAGCGGAASSSSSPSSSPSSSLTLSHTCHDSLDLGQNLKSVVAGMGTATMDLDVSHTTPLVDSLPASPLLPSTAVYLRASSVKSIDYGDFERIMAQPTNVSSSIASTLAISSRSTSTVAVATSNRGHSPSSTAVDGYIQRRRVRTRGEGDFVPSTTNEPLPHLPPTTTQRTIPSYQEIWGDDWGGDVVDDHCLWKPSPELRGVGEETPTLMSKRSRGIDIHTTARTVMVGDHRHASCDSNPILPIAADPENVHRSETVVMVVDEVIDRRPPSMPTMTSIPMPIPLSPQMLPPLTNGGFYEEESAWRLHNPNFPAESNEKLTTLRDGDFVSKINPRTPEEELQPLPPPLPLLLSSCLPNTGFCTWSYDDKSRVLLADFRNAPHQQESDDGGRKVVRIMREDEIFLLQMMEKDDITVISEGLADAINSLLWEKDYIEGCIGSEYHHKFRSFVKGRENNGWYSMKFSDYYQYLERRESVMSHGSNGSNSKDIPGREFTFIDSYGKEIIVNVENEAIYMLDVDATKLLPHAWEDVQMNFKLPGILPGGSHCMMNAVNASGRPFMGPNLYVTPPTSFTAFHQDGHGTVDSGHWCMTGYNEVVMLRRLTERHKCHAVKLLTDTSDSYATLYGLPHRDDLTIQPDWPSSEAIDLCNKMGYCPSVFILKPGQVVHINKGRLHAFRKLAPTTLHESDCHYELRNTILRSNEKPTEVICMSIAWDWMFKGVTSEGINREVSSILECSRLNRQHELQSLAIPETALLFLAKENIAKYLIESKTSTTHANSSPFVRDKFIPDSKTVIRGILPSLEYVVTRHRSAVEFSEHWEQKTKNVKDSWCVLIDSKPNTWQDPLKFPLDPYGAGDFYCKICSEELSNVYMHCDGCEKLLNKDFNICSGCHMVGRYQIFHQMHPFNNKAQSILNHTGNKTQLRRSRCPCKNGKECIYCSYCTGCSCRCHQRFTVHYRFMKQENELELLQKAESIVGSHTIPQKDETRSRLLSLIFHTEVVDSKVVDATKGEKVQKTPPSPCPRVAAAEVDLENLYTAKRKAKREVFVDRIPAGGENTKHIAKKVSAPKQRTDNTLPIYYSCPNCERKMTYHSSKTAGASFANHLRYCGQPKVEKTVLGPTPVYK